MGQLFGRLTNGELEAAPTILFHNNTQTINPTKEMYLAAGYYPVIYNVLDENGFPVYTLENNTIVVIVK